MSEDALLSQNFVDYFFVAGLDLSAGLENFDSSEQDENIGCTASVIPPLERSYRCRVLEHYPEITIGHKFDADSVALMTMPHGLCFCNQKNFAEPRAHHFLITKEDGQRISGVAVLFYEEVDDENIMAAFTTLQKIYEAEAAAGVYSTNLESLPGPGGSGGFDDVVSLTSMNAFWESSDRLFACKAIGLLSRQPHCHSLEQWLWDMVTAIQTSTPPPLPYEAYLANLLFHVPLAPSGRSLRFQGIYRALHCQRPGSAELPSFELSLRILLELLGVENLLRVYTCVLLEHRILLLSTDYRTLMLVAEGLTTLLFPFVWPHTYVPILPANLQHFVETPFPFIMGLRVAPGEPPPQLSSEANVCFVEVDRQVVTSPSELPLLPNMAELRQELTNALVCYVNDFNNELDVSPSNHFRSQESLFSALVKSQSFDTPPALPILHQQQQQQQQQQQDHQHTPKQPAVPYQQQQQQQQQQHQHYQHYYQHQGNDSGLSSSRSSYRHSTCSVVSLDVILQRSETFQRVAYLAAEKAGLSLRDLRDSLDHLQQSQLQSAKQQLDQSCHQQYIHMLKFNGAIREIFLNHFLHVFQDYERFVAGTDTITDLNQWSSLKESIQTFNKNDFLMEQSESYVAFLSPFLETQLFACFVDATIMARFDGGMDSAVNGNNTLESGLQIFQIRVRRYKAARSIEAEQDQGLFKGVQVYRLLNNFDESDACINKRSDIDIVAQEPADLVPRLEVQHKQNCFFTLRGEPLRQRSSAAVAALAPSKQAIRRRDRRIKQNQALNIVNENREKFMQESRVKPLRQPNLSDMAPSVMAQTNWKFVEALLKECKAKTKRMVVEKMGTEALSLGHGPDVSVTGVEENTLVTGLCDLLERIWSHGLGERKGKSALWSHLVLYLQRKNDSAHHCTIRRVSTADKLRNLRASSIGANSQGQPPSHPGPTLHSTLSSESSVFKYRLKEALSNVGVDSYSIFRFLHDSEGRKAPPLSSSIGADRGGVTVNPMTSSVIGSLESGNSSSAAYDNGSRRCPDTPESVRRDIYSSLKRSRNRGSIGGAASLLFSGLNNGSGSVSAASVRSLDLTCIFGSPNRSLSDDIRAVQHLAVQVHNERNPSFPVSAPDEVGQARAFVRLALEKKVLHCHLKALLADSRVLRDIYKRFAFLRCEEEREQFLFHLLALNAVEYFCFTTAYQRALMTYRVFVYSGKKFSGHSTTASAWFCLSGQFADSQPRSFPQDGQLLFDFQCVNLGVLSTLRIGHDNAGVSPKWFIEFVLVQNVITGHIYRFPCGRWLGRGVDDGSTERLLVGEMLRVADDEMEGNAPAGSHATLRGSPCLLNSSNSGSLGHLAVNARCRSPSTQRRNSETKLSATQIQEQLSNAVNALVKYFHAHEKERQVSLTSLLCGESGLVPSLELAFNYGFKSSRLFSKKMYVWDYLEKAVSYYQQLLGQTDISTADKRRRALVTVFCRAVRVIGQAVGIGKDGKFQLWLCVGLRDHVLSMWLSLAADAPTTGQHYEERSFLRESVMRDFLLSLLESLNCYVFELEPALIKGVII